MQLNRAAPAAHAGAPSFIEDKRPMLDVSLATGLSTAAALLVISFFSFLGGTVLRKWPDKVQRYTEDIDGWILFMAPATYRASIVTCGHALVAISFVALAAAAIVL